MIKNLEMRSAESNLGMPTIVENEVLTPNLLRIAKKEIEDHSAEVCQIVSAGTLKDIAPSLVLEGSISPKIRRENGVITQEKIDEVKSRIGRHYVQVTEGAPLRCGDGRMLAGYDSSDAEMYGVALGPQLFGATYGLALADRIAIGGIEELKEENTTILNDIDTTKEAAARAGFSSGGHTDLRCANGGEKCGCGQIDGEAAQFKRLENHEVINGVRELAKARLGDRYSREHFLIALEGALKLRSAKDQYLVPAQEIISRIKADNPGSIEKLSVPHNEAFIAIGQKEGHTLHRDEVAAETDGEIECFGSDDWALWAYAKERYSDDPSTQSIFVHSFMIKDGVTLPGLIAEDGSVEILICKDAEPLADKS